MPTLTMPIDLTDPKYDKLFAPKYCGTHPMSEDTEYTIRDKVFILKLFKYGEGEPAFRESIIMANSVEHADTYYVKYKAELPEHKAYSIGLPE